MKYDSGYGIASKRVFNVSRVIVTLHNCKPGFTFKKPFFVAAKYNMSSSSEIWL